MCLKDKELEVSHGDYWSESKAGRGKGVCMCECVCVLQMCLPLRTPQWP